MKDNTIGLDGSIAERKKASIPTDELEEVSEEVENRIKEEDEFDLSPEAIENLIRERDEYCDLLLRKQADFENFKKRITREKKELRLSAQVEILQQLLIILDAFEKGLSTLEENPENAALETYQEGYQLMLREFQTILGKFGVNEIPGVGSYFDPNVHEAIVREITSEHEEGEILDEYRKGYMIGARLLRPTQVKVAVKPTDPTSVGKPESGREQK